MPDDGQTFTSPRPLRVAVIGAGPAGIFAADALTRQQDVPVTVDVLDRLPTPFGLVRYGIAPDHVKMRAIREVLRSTLDRENVRFIGDIEVGTDLSLAELRAHVDAVIYTYGTAHDRALGIQGEQLPGSFSATEITAWYCGHPDVDRTRIEEALGSARDVVVVGVGNVAIDVARVLARTAEELEPTEMPQHVMDALAAAPVRSISVLGRRGPAQASFTNRELEELSELLSAPVTVDPADLPGEDAAPPEDRLKARNITILRRYAEEAVARAAGAADRPGSRTIALRFFARPTRILGSDRVTGVEVARTTVEPDGRVSDTGQISVLPADLVIRCVGYHGAPLPGLPVDARSGTVPNESGRVMRDGRASAGEYVAGWIKRGPVGVVGTTRSDVKETVTALLADAAAGIIVARGDPDDLVHTLRARGGKPVLLDNWKAIDAAEVALGASRARARTTMHDREALIAAARTAAEAGSID